MKRGSSLVEGTETPSTKHMRSYIQEWPWRGPGKSQDCPDKASVHQQVHSSPGGHDDSWVSP